MTNERAPGERAAVVEARLAALLARYPGRFSPEEVEKLRGEVAQLVDAAEQLRACPLTNADEPAPIFRAFGVEG